MSTLPAPDLHAAFLARLQRLFDVLAAALAEDRALLLVLPQSSEPEAHRRWLAQMEAERAGRPHLTTFWQSITPNPAHRAPPLPWTIGHALDLAADGLDGLAEDLCVELTFCADTLVDPKLRNAVLARPELVQQWPRPRREMSVAAAALDALTTAVRSLPPEEHPPSHHVGGYDAENKPLVFYYWPAKAAPAAVAAWARRGLNPIDGIGDALVAEVERGTIPSDILLAADAHTARIPAAGLALLYLAESDVRAGSRKLAMAIDSGKVHHDLMSGMRDWPKDGERHRGAALATRTVRDGDTIERVELFTPGASVQLHLPMTELDAMQDRAIEALRNLRGTKGLRHWAALLRLFSVEGGRSGTYRWLLDEHLVAMGYSERRRRDPKVRADAAREVEALAALELAIYTKGGVLRERRRLLLETGRFERLERSEWKLDGIEFQMNQRVYGGVRESTGEIGHKWMPAPVELATIDHSKFSYAHALGMLLAIRFRWRLDEQRDFLDISGEKLLTLAGIDYKRKRAMRVWEKLEHTLDELRRVTQIGSYRWLQEEDAWSLRGICRITPAAWTIDRAVRGVLPLEKPPDRDKPVTGGELRTWREKRGWSQREAAKRLKVGQAAISKAEAKADDNLGHKIRSAFDLSLDNDDPRSKPDAMVIPKPADPGPKVIPKPADPGSSDS